MPMSRTRERVSGESNQALRWVSQESLAFHSPKSGVKGDICPKESLIGIYHKTNSDMVLSKTFKL